MLVKTVGESKNVTRLGLHQASGMYNNVFLCYIFPHLLVRISLTHDSLVTKSVAKSGVDSYP